jgi:ligand-binding SRPBCC domain-containing protein
MKFVQESRIARTPAEVFAFHQRPEALTSITPPWEHVTVVGNVPPIEPGRRVSLRTKIGPFSVMWVAEYTDEFVPGRLFTDRQVSGPFASWRHRHWFLDDGAGGTILRDEVDYQPPLGLLGRWLGNGFILRKLDKMFKYRHEVTRRLVEQGGGR